MEHNNAAPKQTSDGTFNDQHPDLKNNSKTMFIHLKIRVVVEGQHYWPGAPKGSILLYPHRHFFYITLTLPVVHPERQVEFISFGGKVKSYLFATYGTIDEGDRPMLDFDRNSCESIAINLLKRFPEVLKVSVYEDDENGVEVIRDEISS